MSLVIIQKSKYGYILWKLITYLPFVFSEYICYFLVFIITTAIIYNEWFIYSLYASKWPSLYCGNEKFCKTILLVADPQILGEERENILTRWDSDRYLFNTYGRALQHVNPDNIIFMGDLMDEGSLADQTTFERYLYRFCRIFFLKNKIPLASNNVSLYFIFIIDYIMLLCIKY